MVLQTIPLGHLGTAPFLRIQRPTATTVSPTCDLLPNLLPLSDQVFPVPESRKAATRHQLRAAPLPVIGGRSVSWLYAHPAPPPSELPRHAARSCASDEEDAKRRRKANSLCRGLERFKRLLGVNRTRSEAVQEQPVMLTRAPGLPPKLGQPLHILVCQENRTTTTVRFGSRTCFGLRPLPPKSMCGPSLPRASEGQAARLCERR